MAMELEPIRAIAQRQGSSALAARSQERLTDAEAEMLTTLLDQIAGNWPHQELGDTTAAIWREGIERLAVEYGLARVRDGLAWFINRQKFWPHPSEIRDRVEAIAVAEQEQEKQRRRDLQEAADFDRFLGERRDAGEAEEAVVARFPALSRAWREWKRNGSLVPVKRAVESAVPQDVIDRARAAGQ